MLPGIGPIQLVSGLLIFVRVLGIFTSAPVFSHTNLPGQVKLGLAMILALVLLPVVPHADPAVLDNVFLLGGAVLKEAAVGVIIGFVPTILFVAIQFAGEAVDTQIGFGMVSLADPLLNTHTSIIGQFQYLIATLLFLVINGHHWLLAALVKSFAIVPLGSFAFHPILTGRIVQIVADVFVIGLGIAAPVMLAVFLTDVGLGILGRVAPQMNLMQVGFPVKIAVGLIMLLVSMPFFAVNCQDLFGSMYKDILVVLRAM